MARTNFFFDSNVDSQAYLNLLNNQVLPVVTLNHGFPYWGKGGVPTTSWKVLSPNPPLKNPPNRLPPSNVYSPHWRLIPPLWITIFNNPLKVSFLFLLHTLCMHKLCKFWLWRSIFAFTLKKFWMVKITPHQVPTTW